MQRQKGKALNVDVTDAEDSNSSDDQDGHKTAASTTKPDKHDNGWARRQERRAEREKEEQDQARREERKEAMKRADKHAPMVMSAKKMVTRKRNVVEPEKMVSTCQILSRFSC